MCKVQEKFIVSAVLDTPSVCQTSQLDVNAYEIRRNPLRNNLDSHQNLFVLDQRFSLTMDELI